MYLKYERNYSKSNKFQKISVSPSSKLNKAINPNIIIIIMWKLIVFYTCCSYYNEGLK